MHEAGEIFRVGEAGHVHVETSGDSFIGGVFRIFGKAVSLERSDSPGIRNNEALKTPILAQNICEQPVISGGGDVVQVHVRAHEAAGASLFGCMKRNKVDIAHEFFGNVRRVIIAATVGCAVSSEVLDACQHAVRTERLALESDDLRAGHRSAKVGVFAGPLDDATPARVPGDVDHGGESPADAGGTCVLTGEMLRGLFHARIPGGSHGQRNREDGAVSVDDVEGEKDRDVEPGFVNGEVLESVNLLDVDEPQNGADLALDDEVVRLLGSQHGHDDSRRLVHLADLLFDGHLLEEFFRTAMRLGGGHGRRLPGKDGWEGDEEGGGKNDGFGEGFDWHHRAGSSLGPLSIKHEDKDLQSGRWMGISTEV